MYSCGSLDWKMLSGKRSSSFSCVNVMSVATPRFTGIGEIERLRFLMPDLLMDVVDLSGSIATKGKLISTWRIPNRRFQICLDLSAWQFLDVDIKNILFWHEVAKIQNGSITSTRLEYVTIVASTFLGLLDITTHNIGILAASLLIAGLSGFRLYQKQMGELCLQQLTAADRGAIELAMDFGYEPLLAKELLKSAILTLKKQTGSRLLRDRYMARLQVLDITPLPSFPRSA
jgi:Protein of unknown function (DUF3318)